jgi:predicted 2-oxoglutarate/Fe(II)-dependent dioxygenase YbiX
MTMNDARPAAYGAGTTRAGYAKQAIPPDLFDRIREFLAAHEHLAREEVVEGGYVRNAASRASDIVDLSEGLRREIHTRLRPICETWCGQALEPSSVYGIRKYYRGTTLSVHQDRNSLDISAILNIAQAVEEPWPLVLEENGRTHRCFLEAGEMLLYEGTRLPHGRPEPLVGEHYCNVFVHYRPRLTFATQLPGPAAFKVFPAALSAGACARIVRDATSSGLPASHWVNDVFKSLAWSANDAAWGYRLSHAESGRFVTGSESGLAGDPPSGQIRRLSIVANLSAPGDYRGGDLLIHDEARRTELFQAPRGAPFAGLLAQQGTVLVIPTYLHCSVHPVTAGVRYSLVASVLGPEDSPQEQ